MGLGSRSPTGTDNVAIEWNSPSAPYIPDLIITMAYVVHDGVDGKIDGCDVRRHYNVSIIGSIHRRLQS